MCVKSCRYTLVWNNEKNLPCYNLATT
jgi:hypothetical protein